MTSWMLWGMVVIADVVPRWVTVATISSSSSKWSGRKYLAFASATNMSTLCSSIGTDHDPNASRYSSVIAMST